MGYYDKLPMSELIGKVFTKVYKDDETIVLENDEQTYELAHDQCCCEDVTIDDIWGDLSNLENAEITYSERTTSEDNPKPDSYGSSTWTFFKIATVKGWVDIRFYGTSNGYYSEDADLYKTRDINEEE